MKKTILTKIDAVNFTLEKIEENLRLISNALKESVVSNGHSHLYWQFEYFYLAKMRNLAKLESLEKMILEFN